MSETPRLHASHIPNAQGTQCIRCAVIVGEAAGRIACDYADRPTLARRRDDFEQANKAFILFTLDERLLALEKFARLQYPSISDRFFEAVYQVIVMREGQG